MKILFVSSGNSKSGISPIIKNQGVSLRNLGHDVTFYTIKGKGALGYLKNIFTLRNYLKTTNFDIIHAHYSLSAIVASLAGANPLFVSLMGSDVKASSFSKYTIKAFNAAFWKKTIVKSEDMKRACGIKNAVIIPNGVDFKKFQEYDQEEALKKIGWNPDYIHILFVAHPGRPEKNFSLAKNAFDLLTNDRLQLQTLVDVPHEKMPYYFNAAEVVLLTSLWEGSPNVIKEAMVCNRKIVATNVGDIKELTGSTSGCFVTGFQPEEVAQAIQKALILPSKTEGRKAIPHLDDQIIAERIAQLYQTQHV